MIKRPLNARFSEHVLDGRKTTTIRDKPWPVGIQIMLYNWSGAAYRSKQIDVAAVVVLQTWPIEIHRTLGNFVFYTHQMMHEKPLYESEGFDSFSDMDDWFLTLVKPGGVIEKHVMQFEVVEVRK